MLYFLCLACGQRRVSGAPVGRGNPQADSPASGFHWHGYGAGGAEEVPSESLPGFLFTADLRGALRTGYLADLLVLLQLSGSERPI